MKLLKRHNYSLKDNKVTDERTFFNRRKIMLGLTGIIANSFIKNSYANKVSSSFYKLENRKLTSYDILTKYNNFFEFGTTKQIWKSAQNLNLENWKIKVEGGKYDNKSFYFDDIMKKFTFEERIYKFRCVEAWSMVIPWYGFQLSELISYLNPSSSVKFVCFETFYQPQQARNQKQDWYPWPYSEIITIDEALNPLAFIATGIYGKSLPKQNGAPLRLVLPWKYGFKSIKSIVKIKFLEKKVKSFWQTIEPREYGFWANVNPDVPHRRWSQEYEKDIGSGKRYKTEIFNGYGELVENLYSNKSNENLYF